MGTWKKFEEIKAWQRARKLNKEIFEFLNTEPAKKDFAFKDQIRRSSGSTMDNIAEGFGRGGNKEFIHFLSISNGSVNEVKSQLYRALDQNYINQQKFDDLYNSASETSGMIIGLINYLKNSGWKGSKFLFILFLIVGLILLN